MDNTKILEKQSQKEQKKSPSKTGLESLYGIWKDNKTLEKEVEKLIIEENNIYKKAYKNKSNLTFEDLYGILKTNTNNQEIEESQKIFEGKV